MNASSKEEAIRQLVCLLSINGKCRNEESLLAAVLEREALRSTGLEHGLAMPHAKSDTCDHLVMAIGRPVVPIDFQSRDGKPTELVVLLASPPDISGPHIQAMGRISRLMQLDEFRQAVARVDSAQEIYDLIVQSEI